MQEQEQKPARRVGTNEERAARLDEITDIAKQIQQSEAAAREEKSRRLRAARLARQGARPTKN